MLTEAEKKHAKHLIKTNSVFKDLTPQELSYVIDHSTIEEIKKNDILISQGDVGDCMYIVMEGNLSVWINAQDTKQKVGEANVGDFIGELALLTQEYRSATVRAETDAKLMKIGAESSTVINANPLVIKAFYKKSLSRLKNNFSGWFATTGTVQDVPPFWRQTMMVLLVIFPIVGLEIKFLNPILIALNPAVGLFISCSISILSTSWLMPTAIYFFEWWLYPKNSERPLRVAVEYFLIMCVYAAEVAVMWPLLRQ